MTVASARIVLVLATLVAIPAAARAQDTRPTVTVRASRPNLRVHLLVGTAMDLSGLEITAAGVRGAAEDTVASCVAPCTLRVPPGVYALAVSEGGATPHRSDHPYLSVQRDVTLEVEHESRELWRVVGYTAVTAGCVASLIAISLLMVEIVELLVPGGLYGHIDDYSAWILSMSGAFVLGLAVGVPLALLEDQADTRVVR